MIRSRATHIGTTAMVVAALLLVVIASAWEREYAGSPWLWRFAPLLLALPVAALVTIWTFRTATLPMRRRAKGLCSNCGYDLRAAFEFTPSGYTRCPECGRSVKMLRRYRQPR